MDAIFQVKYLNDRFREHAAVLAMFSRGEIRQVQLVYNLELIVKEVRCVRQLTANLEVLNLVSRVTSKVKQTLELLKTE